jgi:hypothetical protein
VTFYRSCTRFRVSFHHEISFTKNSMPDVSHLPYFCLFPRLKITLKCRHFGTINRWSRQSRRLCRTPSQDRTSRMHLKMAEAMGTVHMHGRVCFEGDGGQWAQS